MWCKACKTLGQMPRTRTAPLFHSFYQQADPSQQDQFGVAATDEEWVKRCAVPFGTGCTTARRLGRVGVQQGWMSSATAQKSSRCPLTSLPALTLTPDPLHRPEPCAITDIQGKIHLVGGGRTCMWNWPRSAASPRSLVLVQAPSAPRCCPAFLQGMPLCKFRCFGSDRFD